MALQLPSNASLPAVPRLLAVGCDDAVESDEANWKAGCSKELTIAKKQSREARSGKLASAVT